MVDAVCQFVIGQSETRCAGSKIEGTDREDIVTEETAELRKTLKAEITGKMIDTSSGAQPESKLDKVVDALANMSTKPEINHTVNSVATEITKFSGSSNADSSAEERLHVYEAVMDT